MSREDFKRGKWRIAIGVDHMTGAFVQLWLTEEQDGADVIVDSRGVIIDDPNTLLDPRLPVRFVNNLRTLHKRFEAWKASHPKGPMPNLGRDDVVNFVKCFDPDWGEELTKDIYRIMD
jgi:hypothetical protein